MTRSPPNNALQRTRRQSLRSFLLAAELESFAERWLEGVRGSGAGRAQIQGVVYLSLPLCPAFSPVASRAGKNTLAAVTANMPEELPNTSPAGELCGVWVDDDGRAHLAVATADGGRKEQVETFRPFAWLGDATMVGGVAGVEVEPLKGEGAFRWLAHAPERVAFEEFVREVPEGAVVDWIRPLENQ